MGWLVRVKYKKESEFFSFSSFEGFPLIPVSIAVALRPDSYGSREM